MAQNKSITIEQIGDYFVVTLNNTGNKHILPSPRELVRNLAQYFEVDDPVESVEKVIASSTATKVIS